MESRIARMERELRVQRGLSTALALVVVVSLVAAFRSPSVTDEVLRVRGLVVVDEAGRERILIGAPLPAAAGRIRTDPARARETWASAFPDPDAFMELYAGYEHSTNGILVLDENGHDRIAIGSPTPDLYFGKRIGPATGIQINDERGLERTGYGLLDVDGTKRVVLGLDSAEGTEGLTLALVDGAYAGLLVNHEGRSCFLGGSQAGMLGPAAFHGLSIKDGAATRYELDALSEE